MRPGGRVRNIRRLHGMLQRQPPSTGMQKTQGLPILWTPRSHRHRLPGCKSDATKRPGLSNLHRRRNRGQKCEKTSSSLEKLPTIQSKEGGEGKRGKTKARSKSNQKRSPGPPSTQRSNPRIHSLDGVIEQGPFRRSGASELKGRLRFVILRIIHATK